MLKKYKNRLFDSIRDSGIGNNFEIRLQEIDHYTELSLTNSELKLLIFNPADSFDLFYYRFSRFAPNYPLSDFAPGPDSYTDFATIHGVVVTWIDTVVKRYVEEQNEIDMWQEINNGNKTLNIETIDFGDKNQFSFDEKSQITLALNDLKLLIENKFDLNEKEMGIVNGRLNYLMESKERLNKFDWKSLLINTIINIAIALSFDTQKGQELFLLFKNAFAMIPQLAGN